jgi:hypothetical protein
MFKCWVAISGEKQNAFESEKRLSDKSESYSAKKETAPAENESKRIDSYIPGMRRFGFFDRLISFS